MHQKSSSDLLQKASKNNLAQDNRRGATLEEVQWLKQENPNLRKALAEAILDIQKFKNVSACSQTLVPKAEHDCYKVWRLASSLDKRSAKTTAHKLDS